MNLNNKFWWFVAVSVSITLIIIFSLAVLFWHQLSLEEKLFLLSIIRQNFLYIFSAAFLILAGLGFALDGIFHVYIIPISKLVEETTLITSVNTSHRISLEGSKDIMRLAQIINEGADRYEELQKNIEQRIDLAKSKSEKEKNILAAFMSELPEGVLICNAEGRILFYSKQVKHMLTGANNIIPDSKPESDKSLFRPVENFIGLGRSIFNIVDKNLIAHALDEIAEKLEHKEADISSNFVVVGKGNKLLRAQAVPILSHLREFTGFIIIFNDITQQTEADRIVNFMLQSLTKSMRSSLAGIRSSIEAIVEYPDMESEQLQKFRKIIHHECITLGKVLDNMSSDDSSRFVTQWPLVPILDQNFIELIKSKAEEKLDVIIDIEYSDCHNSVKVDSYSIILGMLCVLNQLSAEIKNRKFICKVQKTGIFVNFDLIWQGSPIKSETLRKWENQILILKDEELPLSLKAVLQYHEAEIWSNVCDGERDKSYLRLILPAIETCEPENIRRITILPESRPEFYDFDMFSQPGQVPELDNRQLNELVFTVFDTETTGLDPRGGDKIISIGSVRIVNCRLLRDEHFEQFVDPERFLPFESIKIHGIQPEMLKGQPTIDKVLPFFYRFAEDTILVAHNAAFDMRMLQISEAETGIKFINPVLDTLLLSAVVHPTQDNHDLEAIAKRLGTSIVGRHTALGDAIATGDIFLKLIPLLAKQGIYTLKEARIASQKTYYARLKY
ncbi:MAG: DNA polymerase III subunit epsilon [Deltaproteobacteria bacterium]|nr:DNA polymerase III subunit epsilon [Deltaproteobacteria bacterium]MBW2661678.1 DNA polymerase III subunit epsilon [Deltaproteobacteria bacterium]